MSSLAEFILTKWPQHAAAGSYDAIAAAGNAASVLPNPQDQPADVPAPVGLKQIMAVVPAAEMARIYRLSGFIDDLRLALSTNDHEYMGILLQIALTDGAISAETAALLQPLQLATVPDPQWTATVAGPSLFAQAGYGVVTAADVQAVLHQWQSARGA